jgi:hypothetical protein
MQARLIALLLRHDSERFRHHIATYAGYTPEPDDTDLRHYRELGVLFALRDELFEDILPRIVRRLSFESPRSTTIEEPPVRGRIDWEHTLAATWSEHPDQPPLALYTHQRQRDFATPENLLTVATLLEYRADVQYVLQHEYLTIGNPALYHPLTEIVERCERELAFPQFAVLRQHMAYGQDAATVEGLEMRVQERLLPGSNSGYADLLTWREQRRSLRLLQRVPYAKQASTLGADPQRDNYLYQLWIYYELVELLHQTGQLELVDPTPGRMRLLFHWGNDDTRCCYELRHDQAIADPLARWTTTPQAGDVPGVRPDFVLRRIEPPLQTVVSGGELIWREPLVIWDAKYYRERESPRTPSSPIKRMLADLLLLGEPYGVLLFAFLHDLPTSADRNDTLAMNGNGQEYIGGNGRRLAPAKGQDQTIIPDQQVAIHWLLPAGAAGADYVAQLLTPLLNDMHDRLHLPRVPQCQGIFLDSLSAVEQAAWYTRYGEQIGAGVDTADDLLLCPKPHIGHWRVDLVSRQQHCCQDARLCHIVMQTDKHPPLRPPRTIEDLLKELQRLFDQRDATDSNEQEPWDEAAVQIIAQQVEQMTRRFAEVAGVYRRIEVYYHRLRDMGMSRTWHLLGDQLRESLALAVFLVEQLDSIQAQDYSAPALHISSVLELENQRLVFACPELVGQDANPRKQTLGALPFMQRAYKERWYNKQDARENWQRITAYAKQHWQGKIDPNEQLVRFDDYVFQLDFISKQRNSAAHTGVLSRGEYQRLFEVVCQRGKRLPFGALNVLLLAWS